MSAEVSYTRINWTDRVVERPRTYEETTNLDGSVTHTPANGSVIAAGTPRSAANMNIMDKGIKDVVDAHNALREDHDELAEDVAEHLTDYENPHKVGFYQAMVETFGDSVTPPDAVGSYTGTGSGQGNVTVNGASRKGDFHSVGFAPSMVVILVPGSGGLSPMSEKDLDTGGVADLLFGPVSGIVRIAPGVNYYHSGCGVSMGTAAPETMLDKKHGGAVVYSTGFIVQAYNDQDNDTVMKINCKDVEYTWLAWR